jgi:hypothetical protein
MVQIILASIGFFFLCVIIGFILGIIAKICCSIFEKNHYIDYNDMYIILFKFRYALDGDQIKRKY